jgi:hypothetical protein
MCAQFLGLGVGVKADSFTQQPQWDGHTIALEYNCDQLIAMKVDQLMTWWRKWHLGIAHDITLMLGGSSVETIPQNICFVKCSVSIVERVKADEPIMCSTMERMSAVWPVVGSDMEPGSLNDTPTAPILASAGRIRTIAHGLGASLPELTKWPCGPD